MLLQPGHGRKLCRRGCRAFEPCSYPIVGKLGATEHSCPVDVGLRHCAVGGNDHFHHDCQAFLALAHGSKVGRQLLWQHRKNFGGRVDGSGVGSRVVVNRGILYDQRVDVGDGDEDFHSTVCCLVRNRKLIEIAGIVVINRTPKQAPQIANRCAGRDGRIRNPVGLGKGFG